MYIVYELFDPSESDLPRYVGWGPAPSPWLALWGRSEGVEPKLGGWFRTLRERAVQPLVGRCMDVSTIAGARQIAAFRVEQIAEWAGTAPNLPSWLLNEPTTRLAKPVVRQRADGSRDWFASVRAASKATGHTRGSVAAWARSGCEDREGCSWWFDFNDCAG